MGWFDEQIRQSKQNDRDLFEDSIFRIASVVMGKRPETTGGERIATKAAIDEILKYFHFKPAVIPDSVEDADEQLEYCLRPYGIMRRRIALKKGWHKDCYGPLLAFNKESGVPMALLPRASSGYSFYDWESGRKKKVDGKTAELVGEDAIAFYRPLPQKKLGPLDLLRFMQQSVSRMDNAFLIGMTLLTILVGMLLPVISRFMTGYVLENGETTVFLGAAVFLLCSLIAGALLSAVKNLGVTRLKIRTSVPMEAAVMARLINLPANFFRDYSAGELSSKFQAVGHLCTHLIDYFFTVRLTASLSLLYIIQIILYTPVLTVPALIVFVLLGLIRLITMVLQTRVNRRVIESTAKNTGLTYSLINGVQKIKLSGAEKRAFAQWGESYAELLHSKYNIPAFLKLNKAITTAVSLLGVIMFYQLAVKANMAPSAYIAFNAAYGAVIAALTALADSVVSVAQIRPILETIDPILKTQPEASSQREMVTSLSGNIELSNVYFRYKENMPYVVNGMNLRIKAGEYVGIVGTTGCGKSTLMRLLLGFETPEKGAIYYDRKELAKLDLRSLRRRIGAVTQDGTLFQGDIYSNIAISAPQLSVTDAWEAAEIAGIAEDIRAMPMQMHTVIAEGQGGISGGQKQRLMIARAIAPKPKILMFDEATSALDNKTQKQISDALDKMNCTRIVIAHRLSTIKNCDRILMLDKGQIVESGTYEELIARNGLFADLVARQQLD